MISEEFKKLRDRKRPITLEEYKSLRGSAWEFDFIIPNLEDEALVWVVEHTISNCKPMHRGPNVPASTYDEKAIHVLLPEVTKRLM